MENILKSIIYQFEKLSISQEYLSDLLLDLEMGTIEPYNVAWAVKGYLRCSNHAKQLDSAYFDRFYDSVNEWLAHESN